MTEEQFNAIKSDFTKLINLILAGEYKYYDTYGSVGVFNGVLHYNYINEDKFSHTEDIPYYKDGSYKNKHKWVVRYSLDFKNDSYQFTLNRSYKYYSNTWKPECCGPDKSYTWQKFKPVNNDFVDFMSNLVDDFHVDEGGGIEFDVAAANSLVKSIIDKYTELETLNSNNLPNDIATNELYKYIIELTDSYTIRCSTDDIYQSIITEESFNIRFYDKNILLFTICFYGDVDPFTIVIQSKHNSTGDIVDNKNKLEKIIQELNTD